MLLLGISLWSFNRSGGVVPPSPPVNTESPTIDITAAAVTANITASPGTWTGSPTFTYEWQWEDETVIGTGTVYTVQSSDVGHQIHVVVTGTNGTGSNMASSSSTDTVLPIPVNDVPPIITSSGDVDNPVVGDSLMGGGDTWSDWNYNGSNFTLEFKWEDETVIATVFDGGTPYVVQISDIGHQIHGTQTAYAGPDTSAPVHTSVDTSNQSGVVLPL